MSAAYAKRVAPGELYRCVLDELGLPRARRTPWPVWVGGGAGYQLGRIVGMRRGKVWFELVSGAQSGLVAGAPGAIKRT